MATTDVAGDGRAIGAGGIAALLVGVAVVGSNSLVLSPILSDVARDLRTDAAGVARAMAAYGGATTLSALLLAPLVDRYGIRSALLAGAAALFAGLVLSALSGSILALAGAQALAGLAAGVMLPAIYAAATTLARPSDGVLGKVLLGWSLALVGGVPLSALIAERAGWQASFAVLAGLAALAATGFLALPRQAPRASSKAAGGPIGGLGGAARRPGVAPLLLVQLLFMTAFYGTYAFLGDRLRTSLDLSSGGAGAVVLAYGIGFGLASLADGALSRIGGRRGMTLALLLVAAAYAALPLATTTLTGALAAAAFWGVANHLAMNAVVLRLGRLGGERAGAVLGLNSAVTYAGALAGPLLLGAAYGAGGFGPVAFGASAAAALAAAIATASRAGEGRPEG